MMEQSVENFDHIKDDHELYSEWLSYCECCESLNPPDQPSYRRFMGFQKYIRRLD